MVDGVGHGQTHVDPEAWNDVRAGLAKTVLICARGLMRDAEISSPVTGWALYKIYLHETYVRVDLLTICEILLNACEIIRYRARPA